MRIQIDQTNTKSCYSFIIITYFNTMVQGQGPDIGVLRIVAAKKCENQSPRYPMDESKRIIDSLHCIKCS